MNTQYNEWFILNKSLHKISNFCPDFIFCFSDETIINLQHDLN